MARGLSALICGWAIGTAACGSSPALDAEGLESSIPAALVPDAPEAVEAVDCPDVIVGPATVNCTARIGPEPIDITVVISDDDRATVSTDAVVVERAAIEATAAQRLSSDLGVETTVACSGPSVLVSVPGTTVACDAVDPDGTAHAVTVTIRSEAGDWDLRLG